MEGDSQESNYNSWKKRNVEALHRIKDLESQIAQVRCEVRSKQARIAVCQRSRQQRAKKVDHRHDFGSNSTPRKSLWDETRDGKRDLRQSMLDTVDLMCDKLESLLKTQHEFRPPDRKAISIALVDLLQKRKHTLFESLEARLKHRGPEPDWSRTRNDPGTEQEWTKGRQAFQEALLESARDTRQWQKETQQLTAAEATIRHQIASQVRRLHSQYPDIQEALIDSIITKAERQQAIMVLETMQRHKNELEKLAHDASQQANLHDLSVEADQIIRKATEYMTQIRRLSKTNRLCREEIRQQREKIELYIQQKQLPFIEKLDTLTLSTGNDSIDKLQDQLHDPSFSEIEKKTTLFKEINKVINPACDLSPEHILTCIIDALVKVNVLEQQEPSLASSDARQALETQARRQLTRQDRGGHSTISEKDDPVEVIRTTMESLQRRSAKEEADFVSQQSQQISSMLDMVRHQKADIGAVKEALDERDLVSNGTLGGDYTVQDKTLHEWFATLKVLS